MSDPTESPLPRLRRKRTKAERDRDLELTARLALRGLTVGEIAEELAKQRQYSLSRAQIYYDLDTLREAWQASANLTFGQFKAAELARLGEIEREAWRAWGHSKDEGSGDPRHLGSVLGVIDRRAKLIGLLAPLKTEVSGPAGAALTIEVRESAPALAEADKARLVARYVGLSQTGDPNGEG